ncbi:hypothetical protein [Virgibacillus ihumii]|uniref:hypothetical protein n=1 Tax=Virgibacillus ihumii TaxID=2686091 RepID=UPI00157D1147|nr:hypothetical protein [Virgibacillus ihumii]
MSWSFFLQVALLNKGSIVLRRSIDNHLACSALAGYVNELKTDEKLTDMFAKTVSAALNGNMLAGIKRDREGN